MAEHTAIEWCDHTFNLIRGCEMLKLEDGTVHPACVDCYAKNGSKINPSTLGTWGSEEAGGTRIFAAEKYRRDPHKWNRQAKRGGVRRRVFAYSYGDVFEDWNGPLLDSKGREVLVDREGRFFSFRAGDITRRPATMRDARRDLGETIRATPWLDWLVLTKRPGNVPRMIRQMFPCPNDTDGDGDCAICANGMGHIVPNLWLGTSVSDQKTANELLPDLMRCRWFTPVLFVSAEPLLSHVDLRRWLPHSDSDRALEWVIAGGQSGNKARPTHHDWATSLRDQCAATSTPFLWKQWGEWLPIDEYDPWIHGADPDAYRHQFLYPDGSTTPGEDKRHTLPTSMFRVGKKKAGRLLDGREHNDFPRPLTV